MKTTTNQTVPSLTERMKGYADAFKYNITKRTPLIIQIEAPNFGYYTRNYNQPFDESISKCMEDTLQTVSNIPTCTFGFSIYNEISLFLRDWDKLSTNAWHDGDLQKIVSEATSIVTASFNDSIKRSSLKIPLNGLLTFHGHAFILPKDEVVNYFISRQHEGGRESVKRLAHNLYKNSNVNVNNLNNKTLLQMMESDFPTDHWELQPSVFKYGMAMRNDESAPSTNLNLFKDDRNYIEELIYIKGE